MRGRHARETRRERRRRIRSCPSWPLCDCDPRVPRPGQHVVVVHGVPLPVGYEPPSAGLPFTVPDHGDA